MTSEEIKKLKSWLGNGSLNIFGRPFSGKDTQAQQLAKIFDGSIIGGGDVIRQSKHESVKKVVNTGKLAPIQAYLKIIVPYFKQSQFSDKPLILSSVGRWHGEEPGVVEALAASGHQLKAVILLDIDEDIVWERKRAAEALGDRERRADDAHGALDVRLTEFRDKTLPVIEFYRQRGLLIEVDGRKTPAEVTDQIITKLERLAIKEL